METIEFRGKHIDFQHFSGTVIDQRKHETVTVSSEVDPLRGVNVGGMHIPGEKITSEVNSHHDIWLRLDSGIEKPISLTNIDLKLRTGQSVTFITATNRATQKTVNCGVFNHNADQYKIIRYPAQINDNLKVHHIRFWGIILTIFIWTATLIITSSVWIAAIFTLIYIFTLCIPKIQRVRKLNKQIEEILDTYISNVRALKA
ncbi:hypothetical protein CTR2_R30480 [Comamonas thiooxydans]|uniref:hypothetical protein n=1 Tax=Comamonas thiooxydans TaxID=363952 RepID=UPI000B3530F7|nr:hypothetical protein [Comamonas thiooxydans]BDR09710.1 hypothetical protein CTR2_R30480 [Comamonas thiooxydans]